MDSGSLINDFRCGHEVGFQCRINIWSNPTVAPITRVGRTGIGTIRRCSISGGRKRRHWIDEDMVEKRPTEVGLKLQSSSRKKAWSSFSRFTPAGRGQRPGATVIPVFAEVDPLPGSRCHPSRTGIVKSTGPLNPDELACRRRPFCVQR